MSRKSSSRSKATFHFKPEDIALRQNSEQPIEPVSTPVVPEKIRDANTLLPAAPTEQQPQVVAIEKPASRKKTYQKLSHAFVLDQPKATAVQQAEQILKAKPKVSALRFESQLDSPVSALQFANSEKASKIKKTNNLAIAPIPWVTRQWQDETQKQEDQNAGTEALQAGKRSAYSLQSRMRIPQTKSSLRSVMSLRQQAENFAQEILKRGKVRNPVLRYIQKQRIKREYIRSYRAAMRPHATAAGQRTAQGAKRLFGKVMKVVKSRAALYASIALVLLLLAGSLASFAVSATTVMGGNIIGGLGESLRGSEGMVEVARSQLGQVGGEPYWSWYGFPSRVEWCAIFVSWVADQNGFISDGRFPKFAGCSAGESWFRSADAWQERGYQPSPGEVIFFDWDGDGVPDHVGIVESSDGSTVYTIEGNWADSVHTDAYPINSSQIYGYATPNYFD
jgi:hypothetical protein